MVPADTGELPVFNTACFLTLPANIKSQTSSESGHDNGTTGRHLGSKGNSHRGSQCLAEVVAIYRKKTKTMYPVNLAPPSAHCIMSSVVPMIWTPSQSFANYCNLPPPIYLIVKSRTCHNNISVAFLLFLYLKRTRHSSTGNANLL